MKTNTKQKLLLVILLLIGFSIQAQVKKSFTPRYNSTITGEVTMVGNNMLSRTATTNYNGEQDNHDFVDNVYVDIDADNTTFNSSSANLVNPKPGDPCLEIDKVLLYWAAADKGSENNGVEADNQPSWNFNDVKLMLPGQTTYTTLTADEIIYKETYSCVLVCNNSYVKNQNLHCEFKLNIVHFPKLNKFHINKKQLIISCKTIYLLIPHTNEK
ncbi:MAG: hypothetical protein WBF67_02875 [Olleya sp.]